MLKTELERQVGLHKLAPRPPGIQSNLTLALWSKHTPKSLEIDMNIATKSPEAEKNLFDHLKSFTNAPADPEVAGMPIDELQNISIERLVPAKKGSWWLIPKRVADVEGITKA